MKKIFLAFRSAKWKLLFIVLISVSVIPGEQNRVKSCSGGYDSVINDISLFQFDSSLVRKFSSFLPNMYDESLFIYGDPNEDSLNITEWAKYFGGKLSVTATDSLVYVATPETLNKLSAESKDNNFKEVCKYLIILRDSAMMSTRYDDGWSWEYHPKVDSAAYNSSIEKCKTGFKNTSDDFLKLRYAYLTLRGLRFNFRFKDCIDWYEKTILALHPTGTIKYRSMQYYGGALYHTGRIAEANYIFSKLFDEYPPRAGQAAFDFILQETTDWDSLLALTKNSHEKEVVYFLYGRNDPKEALSKIVKINPESEYIPLLLIRLVNNVEDGFQEITRTGMASSSTWYDKFISYNFDWESKSYAGLYGTGKLNTQKTREEATAFVSKITTENKIKDKQLWLAAAAYLNLLTNNLQEANRFIQASLPLLKANSTWSDEVKVLQIIYEVRSLKSIDSSAESNLLAIFNLPLINRKYINQYEDESISNINKYCMQLISDKYHSQGDLLKAELCSRTSDLFYKDSTRERLQQMKEFMMRKDKSPWEKYMLQTYDHSLTEIIESIACIKLYEHKFTDAMKELSLDSAAGMGELNADPFLIHIIDCHDCDAEIDGRKIYSLRAFVQRMIDLRTEISHESDKQKKAELCLEYANGLYNMSYYGNSRVVSGSMITTMATEGTSYTKNKADAVFYNDFYTRYNGNYAAEYWYNQALSNSKDPEFRAQCTWLIAKCQLSDFYQTDKYADGITDFIAFPAYEKMKSEFRTTAYYQEVIKQCEYFAKYAK